MHSGLNLPESVFVLQHLLDPLDEGVQSQDPRVGHALDEIGILDGISSVSQTQSGAVSAELLHGFTERQEIPVRLGHLGGVQHEMTVGSDSSRPLAPLLGPNRAMIVDVVGEMVLDEILPGDSHVHRVPKLELALHLVEGLSFDGALGGKWGVLEEHVVPHFGSHLFGFYAESVGPVGAERTALEEMRHGVVGVVDGGVGEGLDEPLLVPREFGAEAVRPGAGVFVQPVQTALEVLPDFVVVSVHLVQHLVGHLLPRLFAVIHEPLVAQGHHALVTRSGNYRFLRFVVDYGFVLVDQNLLKRFLDILNFFTFELAHDHHL
jgi:hypothetical protein